MKLHYRSIVLLLALKSWKWHFFLQHLEQSNIVVGLLLLWTLTIVILIITNMDHQVYCLVEFNFICTCIYLLLLFFDFLAVHCRLIYWGLQVFWFLLLLCWTYHSPNHLKPSESLITILSNPATLLFFILLTKPR